MTLVHFALNNLISDYKRLCLDNEQCESVANAEQAAGIVAQTTPGTFTGESKSPFIRIFHNYGYQLTSGEFVLMKGLFLFSTVDPIETKYKLLGTRVMRMFSDYCSQSISVSLV